MISLYLAVYAFHMPTFIMIAGYLSRHLDGRADRMKRLIAGAGVPYAIF